MNDIYDWIMFFLFAIATIITGVSVFKWTDWKRESNENLKLYLNEKIALDSVKAELDKKNEELQTYKNMERVIKIEKVTVQPRELECKFPIHERFIEDTVTFKKICISEVARYLAEEMDKDDHLCKVFYERNSINFHETVRIRCRLLPYPEGAVWEETPQTLYDLYPNPDFSKFKED